MREEQMEPCVKTQDQLDIVDHETDVMELFNRDRQEFYVELLASVDCSSVLPTLP
jgi:hypothetical protein